MQKEGETKVEPFFNQFYQDIVKTVPVLEPGLAMKIMRLEKELLYGPPHVHLDVKYKDGVNYQEKVDAARDNHHVLASVSRWNDGVILTGSMTIELVQKICTDPDITQITGYANAAHN